jgi:hypothetical protein
LLLLLLPLLRKVTDERRALSLPSERLCVSRPTRCNRLFPVGGLLTPIVIRWSRATRPFFQTRLNDSDDCEVLPTKIASFERERDMEAAAEMMTGGLLHEAADCSIILSAFNIYADVRCTSLSAGCI